MSRRLNGPLYSPAPSLEASNQAQIEDLVQRQKTLDHVNKRLTEQLSQEVERSKVNLSKLAEEHQKSESEWRQHLADIIDISRIPQHDTEVDLELERWRALQEMRITREEKLERLKRDYKIKLFQMREEELEQQIVELEEDKEDLFDTLKEQEQQFKASLRQSVSKWKAVSQDLNEARKEKDEVQESYNKLREEHAALGSSVATLNAKLERLKLKYDGEFTKRTDLERSNDELKRTNAELQRQLDEWQHLESKEGNEAEQQRKLRVAAETDLKRLRDQYDKDTKGYEKQVAKLTTASEKLQDELDELKDTLREKEREAEATHQKLRDKVDKLKAALEAKRAHGSAAPSPVPQRKGDQSSRRDEPIKEPEVVEKPPTKKRTTNPKTSRVAKNRQPPSSDEEDQAKAGPSKAAKPQKAKHLKKAKAAQGDEEVEPVEDVEHDAHPVDQEQPDHEVQIIEPSKKAKAKAPPSKDKPMSKATTKRKARDDDNCGEDQPAAKRKSVSKTTVKPLPPPAPERMSDERVEQQSAPKPKKRKLNIFGNVKVPSIFDFSVNNTAGLDIPSILSPIKDSDPVPARSVGGSALKRTF